MQIFVIGVAVSFHNEVQVIDVEIKVQLLYFDSFEERIDHPAWWLMNAGNRGEKYIIKV